MGRCFLWRQLLETALPIPHPAAIAGHLCSADSACGSHTLATAHLGPDVVESGQDRHLYWTADCTKQPFSDTRFFFYSFMYFCVMSCVGLNVSWVYPPPRNKTYATLTGREW